MKHLQFLIFISGLAFAFSLNQFYLPPGEKEGIEVWKLNVKPKFHEIHKENPESIEFSSYYSYIVLRTEYVESTLTENETKMNKNVKKTGINRCPRRLPTKVTEASCAYYIYYIITNQHEWKESANITVSNVVLLLGDVQAKSRKVVTITRERHTKLSNEFWMLFPHISRQKEEETKEWSKIFKKNLFNLYKLTLFLNIEQFPSNIKKINRWEAFVADFGTDLLAISTSNETLKRLTKNFTDFIKRCRSTNVNIHTVESYTDLFQEDEYNFAISRNTREDVNVKYTLRVYEGNQFKDSYFATELIRLYSDVIEENYNYILLSDKHSEIIVFIRPESNIETVEFMLKEGEHWNIMDQYKVSVVQPHKPNISFMIAFKDIVQDILDNKITDNVRKFATVCKNLN